MLIADDLSLSRGAAAILRHVDLTLRGGELLALLGPNGSGKSTLLAQLAGSMQADTGRARVTGRVALNGRPLETLAPRLLATWRAVLPQAAERTFQFTAHEWVLLGRHPHTHGGIARARDRAVADLALTRANAAPFAARDVTTLSGGEFARVQFARALAQIWPGEVRDAACGSTSTQRVRTAPFAQAGQSGQSAKSTLSNLDGAPAPTRFLLLDEPTAALDLNHQHQLLATARALTREWGIGVLAIVHDLNLAARHADRMMFLLDGCVVESGAPARMMRADLIERCFGMPVRIVESPGDVVPFVVPA